MPTQRGFVEGLEVGNAGQAAAFLLHGDGSRGTYTTNDLDGDPEKFYQQLSQLALMRDAMDHAEPIEIEFEDGSGDRGRHIQRVRRLTRDDLARPVQTQRITGTVIGIALAIENRPTAVAEAGDTATLALLVGGAVERFVIRMQTPERGVAEAMVDLARAAQADGARLTVTFEGRTRHVSALETGGEGGDSSGAGEVTAGFVETIAHSQASDLMLVEITTAPPFAGDGNVVALEPFTPEQRLFLVLRGAPEYALMEAALRDGLRIEVLAGEQAGTGDDGQDGARSAPDSPASTPAGGESYLFARAAMSAGSIAERHFALVRGVRLSASLCSASAGVWITVNRHALDVGPDAECAEGLPSSDLRPRGLREMDLEYRAEWIGIGCFNHGVYRFELATDADFTMAVDGEPICIHADAESTARFGHACLDGEHEVRIQFANWSCRQNFDMKVYRIR